MGKGGEEKSGGEERRGEERLILISANASILSIWG